MVLNGGLNPTIANNPQLPRLQPPALPNSSVGPSPFLPLPQFTPTKPDSISLSSPANGATSFVPGSSLNNPFTKPAFPSFPLPPLNNSSTAFPASTSAQAQSASQPDSFALSQAAGANPKADNASLLPSLPEAGKASSASQTGAAASPASQAASPAANAAASASQSLPGGVNGLTPAQQTGKKIGDAATKLLEEVPALQDKISHIDWDTLSQEEIMPKLEKLRVSVQPSVKHIPKFVDRKVGRLFEDPQSQKLAGQFFEWLRKEPDPETLASLQAEKNRSHGGGRPGRDEFDELGDGPKPHRSSRYNSEDDFADDELSSESSEKQSFIGKWRTRAQDAISSIKDRISSRKSDDSKHSHTGKRGHRMMEDDSMDSLDDTDLESLLRGSRGGSGSDDFGPAPHRRRPMRDDY